MGKERYELSDFNSETSLAASGKKNGDGCYVSTAIGFLLALLAILIAVGVGIIVHFAGPAREFECKCSFPSSDGGNTGGQVGGTTKPPMSTTAPPSVEDQCVDLAEQGNPAICNACPKASAPTCAPPTEPTTTPSPTAKPKVTDVRIPLALIPELYTVELQPDMYGSDASQFTFNGSVTITLMCKENANNVTLHTNKLNYTGEIRVHEDGQNANLYDMHTFDMERQFIVIKTKTTLVANRRYKVVITQFIGPLKNDLHGLYLSQYKRDNETISIATTQFQPTDARKTFPCYDEPAIKSEFEITLLRKKHMKSLSNMPIHREEERGDNWVADIYEKSPKMPTYLLAFIVCDFNYTQNTTAGNVTYRAWSRPEAIDQTPYSLRVGVDILDYFEDYFNISYPLPKQDMIAIPDFAAGAMENWGLITYRETAMLYEPGVSSEGNKQRVAVVVSHELAHQWFGNLVTPSWWDDLWLNEGFASYVEYMGVDHVHPDWKMFEQFVISDLQGVFDFDGLISSHPVYVPVAHPDEINEIFDRISYAKGASIIRMMRFFLGDDTFRWGLYEYLWKLRYGAAFHDDLWFALGNQSKALGKEMDVKGIMDTWTLQMNYPTVMVHFSSNGQIQMSQSRYLRDPNATDPGKYTSPFGYKWKIPFTFTTSMEKKWHQNSTDVTWMDKDGGMVNVISADRIPAATGDNWVIGNVMQYGYYRVNYDTRNWNALIKQLNTDHTAIHAINRAQIINDAWNLAKSGDLDMIIALRTTEYLGKEREYVPWSAATGELGYVNTMLKRNGLYGAFEKYMQDKGRPLFDAVGMNNTGATHLESYVRSTAVSLACGYGIQACIGNATELFAQWMGNPDNNPIDPGIKSQVYCTAVAEGGQKEWDFVFQQYQTANLAAEKSRLLSALSCSKQVWLLSRFLDMSIDETIIRKQDSTSVMVGISRNTIGRSLVWDFFRAKWNYLLEEYGAGFFSFSNLIGGISSSFNTDYNLMQLKEFIATHDNLGSGARAFQQAVEKTQSNIQWMENNVPIIRNWLTSQGY